MNLLDRYRSLSMEPGFSSDPAQLRALGVLDRVSRELAERPAPRRLPAILSRLLPRTAALVPVRGAYLWGGVGRGKTFMMDLLFESLPFDDKVRYHFHRLMNRVHGRLTTLDHEQDPLATVAAELAGEARIICFDEFFVADIADAMLLARLLEALFERGVTLVATSNSAPQDLYRSGLQRQRFLPAIELIEQHTEVVHVDGLTDYRLRVLEAAQIWYAPLDQTAQDNLDQYFRKMAPDRRTEGEALDVLGRTITARRRAEGIAWFDFDALCAGPRSQEDYIEIARWFQTVIISGIPRLDESRENEARRFIALVDEFYDRRVKLIVSAAASIGRIYTGTRLGPEFERARSRLLEMQSMEYLAAEHLP